MVRVGQLVFLQQISNGVRGACLDIARHMESPIMASSVRDE